MLRTSSYCINVDIPGDREHILLVHGYTGAYDIVSQEVASYLQFLKTDPRPKPRFGDWTPDPPMRAAVSVPAEQTIETLKRRGYLTAMDCREEETFFCKIAKVLHDSNRRPGYLFIPTYDCNLRCPYCFQNHMRTDQSFCHLLHTISRDMIDRIFLVIPKIELHHGLEENKLGSRSIGFFGGEPLLARCRPIVEYIIDKAQALGEASCWAVTNGTDLEAYRDLLGPEKISFLQITLDGPPHEHDKRRVHADGRGSFECIARNISMALDSGVNVSVRMNIDRVNIEHLPFLADEIVDRGWYRHATFSAYTAPIHAANKETDPKTTLGSWELGPVYIQDSP